MQCNWNGIGRRDLPTMGWKTIDFSYTSMKYLVQCFAWDEDLVMTVVVKTGKIEDSEYWILLAPS